VRRVASHRTSFYKPVPTCGPYELFFWLVMSHNKSTYMYVSVSIPSNNDMNNDHITSIVLVFSTFHGVAFSGSLQTGSVHCGVHLKLSDSGEWTVKRMGTKGERSPC
jgi:hypothetical protein